ncbi:uncharacterized protein J8A68_002431 [[Candida] subhashii]|uniref:COX assembly mitochondrial protein n=1 Tax=[Candida] subhashii TaxID=561895 RepID=A0A8J5UJ05_9ASCO|nr:uncharacterized protein J8A68_002431 [[Candida] subhashii]KAG7664053.1 hypothetical protein J8A68_002431 [[Candida] subhashii]
MHPQLDKNRFDTCEKLMDALEECHRQEFVKQLLGSCNFEKDQLSNCLHYTRVHDSHERIRQSREKKKKFEEKLKRNEEELYGKDGYLKKVIELEQKAKKL